MKTLILILSLSLSSAAIFAQNDSTSGKPVKSNEFGVHLGATTGMGFSYRHWVDNFGFQITELPIKDSYETFNSLGVSVLVSIMENDHLRVFAYWGNHFTHSKYTYDEYDITGTYSHSKTEITNKWHTGFGPGFEFGTKVRFNLMAGYGFYDILGELQMQPTGEIGIYYNF